MLIIRTVKNKYFSLAKNNEGKAFFQKMIGDNYWFIAEFAKGSTLEEVKNGALEGYRQSE